MQRVFDVNNEQDVRDLFDILPDNAMKVEKANDNGRISVVYDFNYSETTELLKINWGNVEEITRPIPEATEADVGKLCVFYDVSICKDEKQNIYTILHHIEYQRENTWFYTNSGDYYAHCRRLTKREIEDLC